MLPESSHLLRTMVQIAPGSPFPPLKPRKVSMSMVADAGLPGYREAKVSLAASSTDPQGLPPRPCIWKSKTKLPKDSELWPACSNCPPCGFTFNSYSNSLTMSYSLSQNLQGTREGDWEAESWNVATIALQSSSQTGPGLQVPRHNHHLCCTWKS